MDDRRRVCESLSDRVPERRYSDASTGRHREKWSISALVFALKKHICKEVLGNACFLRLPMLNYQYSRLNGLAPACGVETDVPRLEIRVFVIG